MNLNDYQTLFVVVTLGSALIVASPVLALVVSFKGGSEQFSEFWLLGPDHIADDYPFDVNAGEMYTVFVGLENHMGSSEYYKVYVKFCNETQSLLDSDEGVPSSLSPLHEYPFFVEDDGVWESSVSLCFNNVVIEDGILSVGEVVINEVSFPVDVYAVWDSESEGYFFQLFFELWRYDADSHSFTFADQSVGLWLNVNIYED